MGTELAKTVKRLSKHVIGREAWRAEQMLCNWLGISEASAAAIIAIHLGAISRWVQGPSQDIEETILTELNSLSQKE